MNIRSEKGITMIALVITVIIMIIIVSAVSFGAKNGTQLRELNNMYTDILALEEKVALYYLKNGELPITEEILAEDSIPEEIMNFDDDGNVIYKYNVNDGPIYKKIDIKKLDNISLNNAKNLLNTSDTYIINTQSHTVYYLKGVQVQEYDLNSSDDGYEGTGFVRNRYYTIPRNYVEIKMSDYIS